MKMSVVRMISLLLTAFAVQAFADDSGREGGGGGGVKKDGRYVTFYSAGFYTEKNSLDPSEIPQITEILSELQALPVGPELTSSFVSAVTPTFDRTYFRVLENTFDTTTRNRLIEEFRRVTGYASEDLTLFAITETNTKTTYLLPEFFNLRPVEQQAILFHEGYWIVHPNATYKEVVQAEVTMQAYLEKRSASSAVNLAKLLGAGNGDLMKMSLALDRASGVINKYSSSDNLPIATLLGEKTVDCILTAGDHDVCWALFKANLVALSVKYPDSVFIRMFVTFANRGEIRFDGSPLMGLANWYKGCSYSVVLRQGELILKYDESLQGFHFRTVKVSGGSSSKPPKRKKVTYQDRFFSQWDDGPGWEGNHWCQDWSSSVAFQRDSKPQL